MEKPGQWDVDEELIEIKHSEVGGECNSNSNGFLYIIDGLLISLLLSHKFAPILYEEISANIFTIIILLCLFHLISIAIGISGIGDDLSFDETKKTISKKKETIDSFPYILLFVILIISYFNFK